MPSNNFDFHSDNSSDHDELAFYNRISPVDCSTLQLMSALSFLIFSLGILVNGSLLFIFCLNRELRNTLNAFIIALAAFNFISSVFSMPFVIVSNYECKWIFQKQGCTISAFIMFFTSCTNVYLLMIISIERFLIIYKPMSMKLINKSTCILAIGFCSTLSFIWAIMPVLGWSYYTLDDSLTSCTVEFNKKTPGVLSYNVTLFGFVFLIPLVLIIVINAKTYRIMKKNTMMSSLSKQTPSFRLRMKSERRLTISTMFVIAGFIVSWTPYALMSMSKAFLNDVDYNPLVSILVALLAKSSIVWTTVLYIVSNRKILKKYTSTTQKFSRETSSELNKQTNELKATYLSKHREALSNAEDDEASCDLYALRSKRRQSNKSASIDRAS